MKLCFKRQRKLLSLYRSKGFPISKYLIKGKTNCTCSTQAKQSVITKLLDMFKDFVYNKICVMHNYSPFPQQYLL